MRIRETPLRVRKGGLNKLFLKKNSGTALNEEPIFANNSQPAFISDNQQNFQSNDQFVN